MDRYPIPDARRPHTFPSASFKVTIVGKGEERVRDMKSLQELHNKIRE